MLSASFFGGVAAEKMGQNERKQLQSVGDFIFPWALYDYFADGGKSADKSKLTNDCFLILHGADKFAAALAELFGKKTKPALAACAKSVCYSGICR